MAEEIYSLHLEAPLTIGEPDPSVVLETALRFEATAYDAVYIALSISQDVRLLSAGKTTRPWVAKLGDRLQKVDG